MRQNILKHTHHCKTIESVYLFKENYLPAAKPSLSVKSLFITIESGSKKFTRIWKQILNKNIK